MKKATQKGEEKRGKGMKKATQKGEEKIEK